MYPKDSACTKFLAVDADITATMLPDALMMVMDRAEALIGGYACFVNAHSAVMTRQDEGVRAAVAGATYAFADGISIYHVGKYLYGLDLDRIAGPDFLSLIFESERGRKLRHYFYGSTPDVLEKLVASLTKQYPGCNIVGAVSPPFRKLTNQEQNAELEAIRDADAQIVWVGLGAPKQELWMHENTNKLPHATLMGIGAAFDFHAGVVDRAPQWVQRLGFEWLHRLIQEPRRLWKRYLVTNFLFVAYVLRDKLPW